MIIGRASRPSLALVLPIFLIGLSIQTVGIPYVATNSATEVASSSAIMNGVLFLNGYSGPITVGFLFDTDKTITSPEITEIKTIKSGGVFSVRVESLEPNTTYFYCAIWAYQGGSGINRGNIMTFTTPIIAPYAHADGASDVTENSATLNGTLASLGNFYSNVELYFEYGLTSEYGNTTPSFSMTAPGSTSANIYGLNPDSTYHFHIVGRT